MSVEDATSGSGVGWGAARSGLRDAVEVLHSCGSGGLLKGVPPVGEWTASTTVNLYRWCVGEGASVLRGAGLDPAALPPPPQCAIGVSGGMVTLVGDAPPSAASALRRLPGSAFVPTFDHLEVLRELVTVHGYTPTPAATGVLQRVAAAGAAAKPHSGRSGSDVGVRFVAVPGAGWRVEGASGGFVEALRRVDGVREVRVGSAGPVFEIPTAAVGEMCRAAQECGVQVPDIPPMFDFDGTIDGLRGVPLAELRTVPAGKRKDFHALGMSNVYDVLHRVPRRYLDRTQIGLVSGLEEGGEVCIVGVVKNVRVDAGRRIVRIQVGDGSGSITATYFNAVWQGKRFTVGDHVTMFGKPERWGRSGGWSMVNPILDPHLPGDVAAGVIPIYPQSGKAGVTTWLIRRAAEEALSRIPGIGDPLPVTVVEGNALVDRWTAMRHIHFPPSVQAAEDARRRIAFDELFRMQMALLLAKGADGQRVGVAHRPSGVLTDSFVASLPYPLTGAQERAVVEIGADLARPHPMHRLLQGDVGAGKTVMALWALLSSVESGHQGALMAPTEILARQLFSEVCERISGLTRPGGGAVVAQFFSNRLRGKKKDAALAQLASGGIDIAVGTHALLADDVQFADLGVAVIDEQHRFGVEQRAALRAKGSGGVAPDLLIMTATPIPRTSAMTVFGDLDVTVLDELPPGRTPIETLWFDSEPVLGDGSAAPWRQVRAEVGRGRQAFVVCPLVEESEKLQAASAEETFSRLKFGALRGLRLGLVHGQQKPEVRDETMASFRAGDVDVLVATTVIEVGVNVPNASVMVVLDAARFGISQLHQLRGRVGRGVHGSFCFLVGEGRSSDARARLEALEETTDGFVLAERDLDIRSHGTIFGASQSGAGDLLVADLRTDRVLLGEARAAAEMMLESDGQLGRHPVLRAEVAAALSEDARRWLGAN